MAYGFSKQLFLPLSSIFLKPPHFREEFLERILCQFRFPDYDFGNSSLFQFSISENLCYREILNVTVSEQRPCREDG